MHGVGASLIYAMITRLGKSSPMSTHYQLAVAAIHVHMYVPVILFFAVFTTSSSPSLTEFSVLLPWNDLVAFTSCTITHTCLVNSHTCYYYNQVHVHCICTFVVICSRTQCAHVHVQVLCSIIGTFGSVFLDIMSPTVSKLYPLRASSRLSLGS